MKLVGEKNLPVRVRRIFVEAIKPFFHYLAIPAVVLLALEFVILLVYFIRSFRQKGDSRRLLVVELVLLLLAIWVVLQNALFVPRILPYFFHRYLGILPFLAAGLYFALIRELELHRKKSAPAHYVLGGAACFCTLASYLSV